MTTLFTDEDLAKADDSKNFLWDARKRPTEFKPVQFDLMDDSFFKFNFIDWWNTRSSLLFPLNPLLRWGSDHKLIDATDMEGWKKQLEQPSNDRCPDSMKGVWWLKYNHAPENLVTIFSDAEFTGTYNEEGTDGYGSWSRPLRHNWSRENAFFGLVFSLWGNKETAVVHGRMNLKDGICTVHGHKGESIQVVYRQNDDEWWKVHYAANTGEEGSDDIEYMYKWLKVLDKDGNPTKFWDEYKQWVEEPLPHKNALSSWFPFWAWGLESKQIAENMCRPNRDQVVNFRV